MIRINEIAFTGYPITDVARARRFYEEVLLLKPTSVFEDAGRFWIEYDIGPGTLAIANIAPEWKPSSDGPSVGLEVEDFDAAIAHLREKGAKFLIEPMNSPVCRMAVIADPDGNTMTIHKRTAHP